MALAAVEPALRVDSAVLSAVLRRFTAKRGTAGGITGRTCDHTKQAATAPAELQEATLDVVNVNLSGAVPRHPTLLDSALIGLKKPDRGVRPIAIGEVWYRVAALCALQAYAGGAMEPLQLGMRRPGASRRLATYCCQR